MHKKGLKTLDLGRPNTLPRLLPSDDIISLSEEEAKAKQRALAKELLSKSKEVGGLIKLSRDASKDGEEMTAAGVSKNLMRELDRHMQEERELRKSQEKTMFVMDKSPLDVFALPGKPPVDVVLPGAGDRNKLLKPKTATSSKRATTAATRGGGGGGGLLCHKKYLHQLEGEL